MKRYKVTFIFLPHGGEYIVNNDGRVAKTLVPVLKRFIGVPVAVMERYIKRNRGVIEELPYVQQTVIGDTNE
jgi:transposase